MEAIEKERLRLTAYVIPGIKTLDDIIAEAFETTIELMKAPGRKREGMDARRFAMWYRKKTTKDSLTKIGSYYSNRDHATVLNASKTAIILKETDKKFRIKAERALEMLEKIKIK